MGFIITCDGMLGYKESVIPRCVYIGRVRDYIWTFCYYDSEEIEEAMKKSASERLGFSLDSLYWDNNGTLFSDEEEFDEADYEHVPIASYMELEIEDAMDYARELRESK